MPDKQIVTPNFPKRDLKRAGDNMVGPLGLGQLTTAQRDAIASPRAGLVLWNTTTAQLEQYNGSSWVALGGISSIVEDTTPELGGELDAGANSIGFTQQTATGDGTTTIDWGNGNKFYFTFGAANETFTFTAPANPCNLVLMMKQDATGSRTATWPATVKWPGGTAPTLSTGANDVDMICFYYDGTNYFGATGGLDFS